MYDDTYDTLATLEPCDEPAESSLRNGLDWDGGNLSHVKDLIRGQIEDGISSGYFFLEADPEPCRFRYLFQPVPPLDDFSYFDPPIYRLIIDTSDGTLRPVTVFIEKNSRRQDKYRTAKRKEMLE